MTWVFARRELVDIYRSDPRLQSLIGPGAPFETEDVVVDGVPLRSFLRAPATIIDAFEMSRVHQSRVHIVFEDERLTFAGVRRQSLSVARQLQSRFGVGRGDRVAIAMRNLPEFVISFWGAAALGAIVVPLNAWWTGSELAYALRDAGAKVVFADRERLERLASDDGTPTEVHLVGVRTEPPAARAAVSFDEMVLGRPLDDAEVVTLQPDDPVTILYTSGTTGRPKGALGTNRGTIANLINMAFGAARDYVISGRDPAVPAQLASIAAAPLFHVGGIAAIVGSVMSGSKIVMMRKWNVAEGVALAERERVTSLGGVPTIARQILEFPDLPKFDLAAVRGFPLGGAPVPPALPRRALETFGESLQILNGYGSTETTSAVVTNIGAEYAQHPDSVGRPNLTADLRVEGSEGQTLGPGEVGELCFRSPQVVKGYWNNPEATGAAFVDGWFHTGDLGYVDADGFVYVVDRLKDVVIRGGENVYCAEVEAVLFEHPAVADVAVIGLLDRDLGERVCAVVVLRTGFEVDLAELRAFASDRLAAYKCPEALRLIKELPRTATGKIAKHQLRATLAHAQDIERTW